MKYYNHMKSHICRRYKKKSQDVYSAFLYIHKFVKAAVICDRLRCLKSGDGKVKVKLSCNKPCRLKGKRECCTSIANWHSAQLGRYSCQLYNPAALYRRRKFLGTTFCQRLSGPQGHWIQKEGIGRIWKFPRTLSGIDPGTFLLEAYCLKQVPPVQPEVSLMRVSNLKTKYFGNMFIKILHREKLICHIVWTCNIIADAFAHHFVSTYSSYPSSNIITD